MINPDCVVLTSTSSTCFALLLRRFQLRTLSGRPFSCFITSKCAQSGLGALVFDQHVSGSSFRKILSPAGATRNSLGRQAPRLQVLSTKEPCKGDIGKL